MSRCTKPGDPPTPRQAELLRFIHGYMMSRHCSPSWREIMGWMGAHSLNAVNRIIKALERRGLVLRHYGAWDQPLKRTLALAGAPMKRTPMGLIPVVDTRTPAGLALLDVLSPRQIAQVPA